MKEHDRIILEKMKSYALQTTQFIKGMTFAQFSSDPKTVAACVFNLTQIGESVGRLNYKFMEQNNRIPWRSIRGLRNKIVHDYEGIGLNLVWEVITDFLPELIRNLENMC